MFSSQKHGFQLNAEDFRSHVNGKFTDIYFLENENISVAVTNYGARIVGLLVKDRSGNPVDVVLGFSSLQDYLDATEIYHGAVVGRYANRIANGQFTLDGNEYFLEKNNGRNHLHGGPNGFHHVVWDVRNHDNQSIELRYLSADGEEGYPGNLQVTVRYELDRSAVRIRFSANTDKTTILNITNHSYFNLNGNGSISDHLLQIDADQITPINEHLIPTGIYQPVDATPFDFREPIRIGERIDNDDIQLKNGGGYDHNFVLRKSAEALARAATAIGDRTGIKLEVHTTEPGMQLYSGNFMEGKHMLKGGMKDDYRTGFCLETQHFPDSPNQTAFPSVVLRKGETFNSETLFVFFTE